jgi:hypothetical protein
MQSSIEKLRNTSAEFVVTELELAITFCEIALSTTNFSRAQRSVADARRAYSSALKFTARMRQDGTRQPHEALVAEKLKQLDSLFAVIEGKQDSCAIEPGSQRSALRNA